MRAPAGLQMTRGRRLEVSDAFSTVGSAIIVTSFVLIAGFLVLTLSPFNINASIGLLTAIMILVALGADLLFLPPLLMQMEAPVPAASKAPAFASAQSPIRGVKNYL